MKKTIISTYIFIFIIFFYNSSVFSNNTEPIHLTCEYQSEPYALDTTVPRFSWWLNDTRRGAKQTAYRVLVASDADMLNTDSADLWDSGKISSNDSTLISYGGKILSSRQLCWWKVMIWDGDGTPSGWSEAASFEMAFLEIGDWAAKWISPDRREVLTEPIPLCEWYCHPKDGDNSGTVFFRAELDLHQQPVSQFTWAAVTASGRYELFINGQKVAEDGISETVEVLTKAPKLKAGKNIIALKVIDQEGSAAVKLGLFQCYFGGKREYFIPKNWICNKMGGVNWNKLGEFNPDGWLKAITTDIKIELSQKIDGPRRSVIVRNEFRLPSKPVRSRVYVSGLGCYELRINGGKVGIDNLTPGWTQYEKRIQYQVYDITRYLKSGKNAVGAILGNAWWSSGLGWYIGERHAKYGEDLRLLAQLEIECEDGSMHTIVSDPSWKWHEAPIVEDTLYDGEKYDARLEQDGWDSSDFNDQNWGNVSIVNDSMAKLCVQSSPAIRVTEELKPVDITKIGPKSYLLDFGQNHPGRPRLTLQAPRGTTIEMVHGEYLNEEGMIERANYRSAQVMDKYICKGGGVETWEARFTYRGFRYMQVNGLSEMPTKDTIVSKVLHTAPAMAGSFECSNPLLEEIWEMTLWGQRSNLHSVPTDCPQRDERLGWLGDAQAFAPMSIWNMDMARFYSKWIRDIQQAQLSNGSVPGVCPTVGSWVIGPGRAAWADAITIIPWYVYLYYGDEHVLEENYDGCKKWVEYMKTQLNTDGLFEQPTWGDWVPVVETPEKPISAMFGYYSTRLLAQMAEITGRKSDAEKYSVHAENQRKAFNAKHLNNDNSYFAGTQAANILPLAFEMTENNVKQDVADHIAADVKKHGGHHTTGFLATPYILPILADNGYSELAYGILNTTEYPSLGYMLANGATTCWERWNSDKEPPAGMNSRNHFAFGSQCQWLFEGLAGLRPDPNNPGFKHVIIKPYFVDGLEYVDVSYPSLYGQLKAAWQRQGDTIELELELPANTTATVMLPADNVADITESRQAINDAECIEYVCIKDGRIVMEILAGKYHFVIK